GEVRVEGDSLVISANGRTYGPIKVTAERDPTKLPWKGVDVAAECTGIFTNSEKAALLLQSGPRKVLVSAPVTWAEAHSDASAQATIVYGVNHHI
ncbi:hypothetical protein JOW44_25045, partial [Escherichia coli]|nr:hypothetical protein [Escherichia coli]